MICTLGRCPTSFAVSEFRPLVETLVALNLPLATPAATGLCRDCITRTLSIVYRDEMGGLHTFAAAWDDTTIDKVPAELIRIYEAVRALRTP